MRRSITKLLVVGIGILRVQSQRLNHFLTSIIDRWEGVMAEASLPEFLTFHLNEKPELPPLPQKFVIIVANPGDMGPRGGIQIDQLESYDQ